MITVSLPITTAETAIQLMLKILYRGMFVVNNTETINMEEMKEGLRSAGVITLSRGHFWACEFRSLDSEN